jgi:hypothetical protein
MIRYVDEWTLAGRQGAKPAIGAKHQCFFFFWWRNFATWQKNVFSKMK